MTGLAKAKGKGSWYFTRTRSCVLCMRTITERERRWTRRPADPRERNEYVEMACGEHFA